MVSKSRVDQTTARKEGRPHLIASPVAKGAVARLAMPRPSATLACLIKSGVAIEVEPRCFVPGGSKKPTQALLFIIFYKLQQTAVANSLQQFTTELRLNKPQIYELWKG
jgi:hypothetical protein